ncbi:uncharacterized protein LOC130591842 [Beta vulgaris subsp. vulgaris]|uniref:uncharacterized protein LOC130591842 n=1 Tax=Beta vulgaris subsp. vulgaris TaxID=3555 RepID=UPI0025484356|nr:uncharacterized protein LOC130591842 [Beta vulgaris subsp. vulgaris]
MSRGNVAGLGGGNSECEDCGKGVDGCCFAQYIHCEVIHRAFGGVFEATIVYGANDAAIREELWRDLERISQYVKEAWVIMGDFNCVLNLGERIGSAVTLEEVAPFRKCIRICQVQDLPTSGPYFTWSNKQEGEQRVFLKIDRGLVNSKWLDKFSNAYALLILENISYHCACVLKLDNTLVEKARPFKLCNMWALDDSFLNIVQTGWQERVEGVPMYRVVKKLKKLKQNLKVLHRNKFSLVENEVDVALIQLLDIQKGIQSHPHNVDLHRVEEEARSNYENLNKAKMSFIRQKVKQEWIKGGDENTRYFHSCLRKRRLRLQIYRIKDEYGRWQENPKEVEEAFLMYYKRLLGTVSEATCHVSNVIIDEGPRVEGRPDGYSSGFFKKAWRQVGAEITLAVLDFFQFGQLLKQINTTTLCLIPKVEQPEEVNQFRPIDCCNVIYKKLQFPDKFRSWIITCITTPTFSLSINDDLMLFSKGDVQSVTLMIRALKAFSDASGLHANHMKSTIYFGNLPEEIRRRLLQVTGFQLGLFPFRYLGVPITPNRISISNCNVLINRILKRIMCWSSRHLSYAGRATLVNAVLLTIHTYWAQVFLLPQYVIQRVTQICRAYLWDGETFLHKPPLVAWEWVCRLKKCSRHGVRDCMVWNTATMGKYMWQIAKKEDTLWIKWIHSIYIREANWWDYTAPSNAS